MKYTPYFFILSLLFLFAHPTFAASPIPLHFQIEQKTAALVPDYEKKLTDLVAIVNERTNEAGIAFQFFVKTIELYSRDDNPTRLYNLSDAFYVHDLNTIYVAYDGLSTGNSMAHTHLSSVFIRGSNSFLPTWNVFDPLAGAYVLSHELMHIFGAPDLYLMNVASINNFVTNRSYKNRYDNDIMSADWSAITYMPYIATLVSKNTFPCGYDCKTWYDFQPKTSSFLLYDKNQNPLPYVNISFFQSSTDGTTQVTIDPTPEYKGFTDKTGTFHVESKLFEEGTNPVTGNKNLPALYLIKTSYAGMTSYNMLELAQVNEKYWKGTTENAKYGLITNFEPKETYEAEWVSQTQGMGIEGAHRLSPGESVTITVQFRNVGTSPWNRAGEHRVGFYVYKDLTYSTPPEYNDSNSSLFGRSYFADSSWGPNYYGTQEQTQAAVLEEDLVEPGHIGTFRFTFNAASDAVPNALIDNPKTKYRDDFYREDLTLAVGPNWMHNSTNGDPFGFAHVWFPIQVVESH